MLHPHVQLPASLGGSSPTPPVFDHRALPAVDMENTPACAHRSTGCTGKLGAGLRLVSDRQTVSLEQPEPAAQQALTCRSWRCCRQKCGWRCHCGLWAHRRHTRCAVPAGKPKASGMSRRQGSRGSPLSSSHPIILLAFTSSLTSHTATCLSLCGLLSNVLDSL